MKKISIGEMLGKLALLVFVIILITLYNDYFGSENTLIGISLVTALLMFLKVDLGIKYRQAPFVIVGLFFLIILASAYLRLNSFVGFGLNLIFIFVIVYLTTEYPEAKSYLPFILCYLFIQGVPVSDETIVARMVSVGICGGIVAVVYWLVHRKKPSPTPTVYSILKHIDIHTERFLYAIKVSVGISVAMLLGMLLNVDKAMWIGLSVFSMIQPSQIEVIQRFKMRMVGTIIGMTIFVVLFLYIIPEAYQPIAVLLFGYIYMFVEDYATQMIFITINALATAVLVFSPGEILVERILLILLGFVIALAVNAVPWQKLLGKIHGKPSKS